MPAPLLVVGLDAGTPDLIERWMADGATPFLAGLAERGGAGRLEGDELMMEDGLWLSLFSGRPRGELSRHSYRQLRDGRYELALADPAEPPPAPMLWEGLVRSGRRVAAVDVPALPPSPGSPVRHVAFWGPHGVSRPLTSTPPELATEVRALAPQMDIVRDHIEATNERADARFFRDILESVERRGRITRAVIEGDCELAVVVFSETHTAGHRLWENERRLREVYSAVDREIDAISEAMGEDTRVVVLVANGLDRRGPVDALMADFCRRLGYSPAPSGVRRPADVLARRAPRRLRALAARAIARSGVNRVAIERFSSASDWSRTRAFAIPDSFVGMIRVNLAGREPAGIVEPGSDYEETVAVLEEDLLALRDPRTGDAAIERVARMRAADGGPPERCPDVVATFRGHEPPLRVLEHPRVTIRQPDPWWVARNGHSARGMIVGAGDGPIACTEVAPSILSLMGERSSAVQ